MKRNRPLQFNNQFTIHHFVMGNTSNIEQIAVRYDPIKNSPSFTPATSLFDRYNRPNLLLSECDQRDIIPLTKNLIAYEQPISGQLAEEIAMGIIKRTQKQSSNTFARTGQQFLFGQKQIDSLLKTAPQGKPSREYMENEAIFNYAEIGKMKKKQKNNYLSQLQKKIAEAEREVEDLQNLQEEEKMELDNLTKFQNKVGEQLTKNVKIGEIKQKVESVSDWMKEQKREPMNIHHEMGTRQINEVLDEHFKLNEQILQAASMAKMKGKSRQKLDKTGTMNNFSNTMKKGLNQQKSMVSTMKNGLKPRKVGKK